MYNSNVMLRLISLVIYIILVPGSFGVLYTIISTKREWILLEIWSEGWALMLAFFSLLFQLSNIFGVEWHEGIWIVWGLLAVTIALISSAIAYIYRKKKDEQVKLLLVRSELFPVYIMVVALFVLSALLLKTPDYSRHMEQYIRVYNAETMGMDADMTEDILLELKNELFTCDGYVFYLTVNKLIRMGADKFLTVIMAFPLLLLSVSCYDFIGERLNIDRKKRYGFLMLIYAIYIVTVFCVEYQLYAIYNYLWEPVTAYVTIFLPFQLGMMLYVEETVYGWKTDIMQCKTTRDMDQEDRRRFTECILWTAAAFLIGYMFPWREWLIILAPEIAGAAIGAVRRMIRGGAEHGTVS